MYLHTRLLLGILAVTLFALLVSVLVPLASLRQDVSRETEASMQLSSLLLDIEAEIRTSDSAAAAAARSRATGARGPPPASRQCDTHRSERNAARRDAP